MIKPGTVCMIRGVPPNTPGYPANGRIVRVVRYLGDAIAANKAIHRDVHEFVPDVVIDNHTFNKSQEIWLHPLDDFEDDLTREALDEAIETTFRETLVKALEKIK
jgi:hypothetical protein